MTPSRIGLWVIPQWRFLDKLTLKTSKKHKKKTRFPADLWPNREPKEPTARLAERPAWASQHQNDILVKSPNKTHWQIKIMKKRGSFMRHMLWFWDGLRIYKQQVFCTSSKLAPKCYHLRFTGYFQRKFRPLALYAFLVKQLEHYAPQSRSCHMKTCSTHTHKMQKRHRLEEIESWIPNHCPKCGNFELFAEKFGSTVYYQGSRQRAVAIQASLDESKQQTTRISLWI